MLLFCLHPCFWGITHLYLLQGTEGPPHPYCLCPSSLWYYPLQLHLLHHLASGVPPSLLVLFTVSLFPMVQAPGPPPSASTIGLQWFSPFHHPVAIMDIIGLLFEQKLGATHYLALSNAIHVNDTYQSILRHAMLGYRKTSPKSSPVPFHLITTFPRTISPQGHLPSKSPQAAAPLVTQPFSMSVGPFTHSWLNHNYSKPVPLSDLCRTLCPWIQSQYR